LLRNPWEDGTGTLCCILEQLAAKKVRKVISKKHDKVTEKG